VDFAGRKNFIDKELIQVCCNMIYSDLSVRPSARISVLPYFVNALFSGKHKIYGDITASFIMEIWQQSKVEFDANFELFIKKMQTENPNVDLDIYYS
jgi:hypothetical protein